MGKLLRRITAAFALAVVLVVSVPRPAAAGSCVTVTVYEPYTQVLVCTPWF